MTYSNIFFLPFRFDFVLRADQPGSTYTMRFAGLFDCAKLKAHAVALLHYNEESDEMSPTLHKDPQYYTDGTKIDFGRVSNVSYEDCAVVAGVELNPLNYAPYYGFVETEADRRNKVPINKLQGIQARECATAGHYDHNYKSEENEQKKPKNVSGGTEVCGK